MRALGANNYEKALGGALAIAYGRDPTLLYCRPPRRSQAGAPAQARRRDWPRGPERAPRQGLAG